MVKVERCDHPQNLLHSAFEKLLADVATVQGCQGKICQDPDGAETRRAPSVRSGHFEARNSPALGPPELNQRGEALDKSLTPRDQCVTAADSVGRVLLPHGQA